MRKTQFIDIPFHYDDMTVSVSMTGLTVLNKGKFKERHSGYKELVQKPTTGLMLKSDDKLEIARLKLLATKKRRKKVVEEKKEVVKRTRSPYKINKKEVSHRIRNFVNQMPGEKQLYFWTVTFPEGTSDDTAFILLNKWLTRLRKENMLRSYLWITERQKNETIHFHIAVHQRICVKKANKFMRACLFTSIDNNEIKYSRQDALKYNGVDIAKNRKTRRVTNFAKHKNEKNLISYLTKYVTKNDAEFYHLAWHGSRDYSNLIISVRMTSREFLVDVIRNFINEEPLFVTEWFNFYKWKKGPSPNFLKYIASANQVALSLLTK